MAETSKQPDPPPPPPQAADEGKKEKTDVTPPADEDQKEIEAKMAAEKKLKAYKKEMPKEIPAWLKNNNSEKARLKAQEARTGIKSKWRDKLFYGEVYEGKKEKWTVDKQIGSGGFSDVYAVKLPDSSKLYAMKTEQCDGEYRMLRLKIDVQVLLAVSKETNEQRKKHFVELFDRGAFGRKFKFLVMTLVGPSIDEVRRNTLEGTDFSRSTATQIAKQTLQALWDLHDLGFLHRDIKSGNFAIGLGSAQSTVFLIDFGIARYIYEKGTKKLRPPRTSVKFLGTYRWASRNGDYGMEQSRSDDLECWLFFVFDTYDMNHGVSWKKLPKKEGVEIFDRKDEFMIMGDPRNPTKPSGYPCFAKTPVEYAEMIEMIDNYDFFDRPDYKRLMEMIDELARKNGISLTDELDWVAKPKKADDKVQPKKDDEFQPKSDDAGERSVDKCRRKRTK